MSEFTYHDIKSLYKQHGYPFREGTFNVNPFAIRARDMVVDEFNDIIGVVFIDNFLNYQCLTFKGTTKPGLYYLKNKLGNIDGTFILKPGFFPDCWVKGKHRGQYEALVQAGPGVFSGWRDADADGELDMHGTIYTNVTGLNLHTTSFVSEVDKVGPYSAGCQVVEDGRDFIVLKTICYKSIDLWKPTLDFALFQF